MRVDCRLFLCARCRMQVLICSVCDRGQRYCSRDCSRISRRESRRAAGRRYQDSSKGRRNHAARQARYRRRQALLLNPSESVTHQGSLPGPPRVTLRGMRQQHSLQAAIVTSSRTTSPLAAPKRRPPSSLLCHFCGEPCRPYVRLGLLRRRRPRSRTGTEVPR
jgi:hypothetical protein